MAESVPGLDTLLSLVVLTDILLVVGSVALWRRGDRRRAGLMAVLAVVMAANVAIWSFPAGPGVGATAPAGK